MGPQVIPNVRSPNWSIWSRERISEDPTATSKLRLTAFDLSLDVSAASELGEPGWNLMDLRAFIFFHLLVSVMTNPPEETAPELVRPP